MYDCCYSELLLPLRKMIFRYHVCLDFFDIQAKSILGSYLLFRKTHLTALINDTPNKKLIKRPNR